MYFATALYANILTTYQGTHYIFTRKCNLGFARDNCKEHCIGVLKCYAVCGASDATVSFWVLINTNISKVFRFLKKPPAYTSIKENLPANNERSVR